MPHDLDRFIEAQDSAYGGYEEAREYLAHPVLGARLRKITTTLLQHKDEDVLTLMGSHIDAVKLRSSMTLFDSISPEDVFGEVLDTFFNLLNKTPASLTNDTGAHLKPCPPLKKRGINQLSFQVLKV